ncbi:MAG: 2-phosphosulfolactate phosphatase [Armatimonadetes bacterium]|nr:2-phosphosulfolactate phosphatase [Armatimonadota bacterium]
MRVEVHFLPDHLEVIRGRVCLVVDVLRATSTIVALFEAGAARVLLAGNHETALRLRAARGGVLIGEEVGRTEAAPGCDFAPSPTLVLGQDFRGRDVIFFTTNGTVAIQRTWQAAPASVRVACLANLGAAAAAAVEEAAAGRCDLAVVCAGRRSSRRFALDDAYCAGILVERILREAAARDLDARAEDGAAAARRIALGFATPEEALRGSATGLMLGADGQARDIAWCARTDWSRIVPIVRPSAEGLLLATEPAC